MGGNGRGNNDRPPVMLKCKALSDKVRQDYSATQCCTNWQEKTDVRRTDTAHSIYSTAI
jgi:hypothetical protein